MLIKMSQRFTEIKNLIIGTYDEINFAEVPEGEYLKISNLLLKIYKICNEQEENDSFEEVENNDISTILENNRVYYDMFIIPPLCECEPNTYQLCESCICDSYINRIKSCCNYNNFILDEPSVLYVLSKFDSNITEIDPFIFIRQESTVEEKDEYYYVRYFRLCIDVYDYYSKDITLLLYIFICNFTIKHLYTLRSKYYQIIQKVYEK